MNQTDRKEFDLIHNKIDNLTQSFIKENMFNPHEGLWAETKLNSQFRESTKKWRTTIGAGFSALFAKSLWEIFSKS